MSTLEAPVLRQANGWYQASLDEWNGLAPRTQVRAKIVFLVAVTVVAYHYSLYSLLQTIGLDTPLAYVGLVPLIAAGLALFNRYPRRPEPPINDRQLDVTLGVPLVAVAVLAGLVLPWRLGAMVWVNRIDLLFLPVFVTGAVVLLFGVRVAWRQKVALGYLILAWPWLYTTILLGTLGGFTSLTLGGLDDVLKVVPVAAAVPGGSSEGLYQVVHSGQAFTLSVVTACSGVDGMVGFILIGTALAAVASGSILRKALWLATGLVLLWLTNLGRLLLIFWVGSALGQHVAIGILHPVAGLAIFCVDVAIMGLLMRPFGLNPGPRPTAAARTVRSSAAAPRVFAVTAILVVAGLVLSVTNSNLRTYNPVAAASGAPKLTSYLADPSSPAGWTESFQAEYTVNRQFFGQTSRWFRYVYTTSSPALTTLHTSLPVTADVIDTADLNSFDAYGVTACYSFHGFTLRNVSQVGLADGISGQALSFSGGSTHQNWSLVYWIWPVATGQGTRYERVVLYLQNTPAATVSVTGVAAAGVRTSGGSPDPVESSLTDNRNFLVAFADQVITAQSHQDDTGVLIDALQSPGQASTFWADEANRGATGATPASTGVVPAVPTAAGTGTVASSVYPQFWANYDRKHPAVPSTVGG